MTKRSKKSGLGGWKARHPFLFNVAAIAVLFCLTGLAAYVIMGLATRHGMKRTVPDMLGLRLIDAEYYASRRGLEIVVNDSLYVASFPGGIVLEQLPKGGVDVKSGRKIYVTVNAFHQPLVPLPYVAGRSLRQAKNTLEGAGLTISELQYVSDMATNYVLAQYYDGKEVTADSALKVERGGGVVLRVGVADDDRFATVPDLIGRPLHQARSRLWESGFNVGGITFDGDIPVGEREKARICYQSLPAHAQREVGSRVSLTATLDAERVSAARSAAEEERRRLAEQEKEEEAARQAETESGGAADTQIIDEFFQ